MSLHWSLGLRGLFCSPAVLPGLSMHECGTAGSASSRTACRVRSTIRHLSGSGRIVRSPLCPGCLSPPLLPVWMNVSSLYPWLSDFCAVRFSVSSGCFFVFKLLLSFFWLCEEVQCVYLCLHLGWKLLELFFKSSILGHMDFDTILKRGSGVVTMYERHLM